MSRSNSKVAILLREADTIKTNKTILKAGGLPHNAEVFNVLESASSKYEEKMAKLLQFNSRSKKSTKVSSLKTEWMDEQARLQTLANKIELSVGSILDTIVAQSPDDEELQELVDMANGYSNARKKNQTEITSQLHNIKELVKESSKRSVLSRNGSEDDKDEPPQASEMNAIVAELFVKLRTDQMKVWKYWFKQEEDLRRDVQRCAVQLAGSMRADNLAVQDLKLREELASILASCTGDVVNGASLARSRSEGPLKDSGGDDCTIGSNTAGAASIAQRLEADLELAIEEWLHKVSLLDKAQELRAIERESERAQAMQELGLSLTGPGSSHGGWSDAEHDTFVKVYKKAQVTGMPRKQLLQVLAAELPSQNAEAIALHEEWYRKLRFIAHKYKEGEATYTAARSELIAQAKVALREFRDQRLDMLEREREAELHEKHRSEIHERLLELQAQKETLDAKQRAERERQQAALRERLAAQEEALRQERLEKKLQLERYREIREAAEAEARRLHDEQVARAREEVRQLVEQNRPRVEHREQLLQEKEDRRRQREREVAEEEMRRIELLNKLAAQVPYFDAIQDPQSRLDHITASAKAHEYIAPEEGTRGHLPLNGFTDGRVIQDTRFRIAEALRQGGVAGSRAAREVVARLYPRPHLAIHGIL